MDCPKCGASLQDGRRDLGSDRGGISVVVTGVPAAAAADCTAARADAGAVKASS